uniref:Guanylate cyclase domain-containing protein n=1 Tax=Heterorhabditis bacteriophora TaxID=37862 RepID=A0A1I7WZU6_HETBA
MSESHTGYFYLMRINEHLPSVVSIVGRYGVRELMRTKRESVLWIVDGYILLLSVEEAAAQYMGVSAQPPLKSSTKHRHSVHASTMQHLQISSAPSEKSNQINEHFVKNNEHFHLNCAHLFGLLFCITL